MKGPPEPSKPFHFCPQAAGLQCCEGREWKGLSSPTLPLSLGQLEKRNWSFSPEP